MDPYLQKHQIGKRFVAMKSVDQFFFFLALIVIINAFLQSDAVGLFASYAMIIMTILSLPRLERTAKLTASAFFSISALLYFLFYEKISPVTELVSTNLSLVTLFLLIPLLGLPIHFGGYIEPLKQIYERHMVQDWKVFSFSNILAYMLSPVMNVAAVSLTADIVPKERRNLSISRALLRGYCLSLPWTPFFASVIFVLSLLSMNWLRIAPFTFGYTMLIVLLGILINIWAEKIRRRNEENDSRSNLSYVNSKDDISWHKIVELAVVIILMVGSIFLVHEFFSLSMTLSVSVVALIFPILWSLYLKQTGQFLKLGRHYVRETLSKVKNEVMIFFSASFFGYVFLDTGLGDYLPQLFHALTNSNTYGLIVAISFTQMILTIVGVHPLVVAIVFAGSLVQGTTLHLTTISFLILSAWGLALTLTPFAAVTLILSRLFKQKPYVIGFRLNWLFIVFAYVVMVMFAIVIETFFNA